MASVDRVKSILRANSGPAKARLNMGGSSTAPVKALPPARLQARITRRDGLRLAAATLLVAGALYGLYAVIGVQPFMTSSGIDEGEAQRKYEAQVQARRMGSILFLSPYQYCELHRFDNLTGNTVGIDYVDCEATVEKQIAADTQGKTDSMKNVLSSFRK